jgi:hypothetical protein
MNHIEIPVVATLQHTRAVSAVERLETELGMKPRPNDSKI